MTIFDFLTFLSAFTAAVTILLMISKYSLDQKTRLFRAFIRNIFFFNLLALEVVFFRSISPLFNLIIPTQSYSWIQAAVLVFMAALKFLWLYSFLEMNAEILSRPLSRSFQRIFIYLSLFFITLPLIAFLTLPSPYNQIMTRLLVVFNETVVIAASFTMILRLLWLTREDEIMQRAKGTMLFSSLYLILFSALLLSLTLGLNIKQAHTEFYKTFDAAILVLYNFSPLIWIRRHGNLAARLLTYDIKNKPQPASISNESSGTGS